MPAISPRIGYVAMPRPFCEKPPRRHIFYPSSHHKIECLTRIKEEEAKEQSLKQWFAKRADRWTAETGIHSSPVIRFMHKDYQSIMARGKEVIPYILDRLKTQPDDWFWALKYLADNYDAAEGANSFDEAVKAWLKWGVENDYISE